MRTWFSSNASRASVASRPASKGSGVPPGREKVPSSCSWIRTRPVTGHSSQPYTWVTGSPAGTGASCQA